VTRIGERCGGGAAHRLHGGVKLPPTQLSNRVDYDPAAGAVSYRTHKGAEVGLDALDWIGLAGPRMTRTCVDDADAGPEAVGCFLSIRAPRVRI
jgi:hypothetical protein